MRDKSHGFAKRSNQDYLQYALILFLEQYLLKWLPGPAAILLCPRGRPKEAQLAEDRAQVGAGGQSPRK